MSELLFWGGNAAFAALIIVSFWFGLPRPAPKLKTNDAIDEEIRAEKIELENTARDYADLQTRPELESYPASFVNAMMVAAFRSGAQWQQRRP